MSQSENTNLLSSLSDAMADAVAHASAWTVMVDARRRLPASGIVYQPTLILTADHVVERDDEIRIGLPNGESAQAQVAGRDPSSDLALLQLVEGELLPAEPAHQPARVGQLALALGKPTLEGIQASLGVVSATGGPLRTRRGSLLEHYMRTDAIPFPGFSGGPLIDANGRALGINTSGLAPGISLTIPTALAWKAADSLAQHGQVKRGYLGIRSQPVILPDSGRQALGREQKSGLLLVGVENNAPAAHGGLMVGDILVALDNQPIEDPDQLLVHLVGAIVGQTAKVQVLRGGQPMTISVKIGERP